jgi:hypothetical protein
MQTDWIKMLLGYDIIFLGSWNRKLNRLTIITVSVVSDSVYLNSLPLVVSLPNL